jgi:hypothetical protein
MKMTELYQEYTVRSLMEKVDMTYTHAYGVIRRMRDKNLITDIKKTDIAGSFNAKRYGLLMDPVEFVRQRARAEPITATTSQDLFQQPVQLEKCRKLKVSEMEKQ